MSSSRHRHRRADQRHDRRGKTGTAETSVGGGDHSWFTGYIAEKHVAVAVYLATETTTTATPIARSIMEALP